MAYLSGLNFSARVESDGGLNVVALTKEDLQYLIRHGFISSGNTALSPYYFYREIEDAIEKNDVQTLIDEGYIAVEEVQISN